MWMFILGFAISLIINFFVFIFILLGIFVIVCILRHTSISNGLAQFCDLFYIYLNKCKPKLVKKILNNTDSINNINNILNRINNDRDEILRKLQEN